MVPAGSLLTFDFRGTAGGWVPTTEDQVRSDLIAQLGGFLTVQSLELHGQGAFYELLEWQFTGRLVARTQVAHAQLADVESIVAHALYEATGHAGTVGAKGTQGDIGSDSPGIVKTITDGIVGEFNFALLILAAVAIVLVVSVGGKTTRVGLS